MAKYGFEDISKKSLGTKKKKLHCYEISSNYMAVSAGLPPHR